MPSPETRRNTTPRKDAEPNPQKLIIYAGTSPKRLSFLRHAFPSPGFIIESVPGGEERNIPSVTTIASEKIDFALRRDDIKTRILNGKGNVFILASDVRISPYIQLSTDSHGKTVSLGKPYDNHQARRTFRRIARAVANEEEDEKQAPFYTVQSGTAIQTRYSRPVDPDFTTIVLDIEKIKHFGTQSGFEEYLKTFEKCYSSPEYRNDNQHPKPNLTDIAAGISLIPLLMEGAVMQIDGIERENPEFRSAVKMALYKVNVGFSEKLLKTLRPDIETVINKWPWLENMTAMALRESPLQS
jgi:hypothetical protein